MASENNFSRYKLIPLLFLSGFCALVYQVAWLRELRLVFGTSTMAISAVLAIFMGGLGLGSYFLGSYAEKHKEPLKLYGYLELGIAVAAFASPFLISVVRLLYIAMGGSQAMGLPLATFVRLVMSAMILGVPTFLMGGMNEGFLRARFEVYKETNHSMIQQAEKDLNDFLKNKNVGLINKANDQ